MRVASKIDLNQPRIVQSLRHMGFHVWHTYEVGFGGPDVVVTGWNNRTERVEALLVEIKAEEGRLTPDEVRWHKEYPEGGPLIVARSEEDVLRWFGRIE